MGEDGERMKKKYKTGESQRKAVKAYQERNKGKQAGIGATFNANEKNYIQAIFAAHGVKPAEILRGAAAALLDGEPIRTERKPLTIPTDSTDPNETPTT